MPRSKITSTSKDIISDDGSILVSVIEGEQVRLHIQLGWITSLAGYTLNAKVVEGANVQGSDIRPTDPEPNGQVVTLDILDPITTDNEFDLVIPSTLINSWATTPEPGQPIYGFIELSVADSGVGSSQQVWKPLRGLVEVYYSATS